MKNILTTLTLLLSFYCLNSQSTMIYQPSGGLNTGSDSGTINGGKDTWENRYAPTDNNGSSYYMGASPRSTCNPSDYKSYIQFDLSNLPSTVDSVFFGITHVEHTTYCYSNCNADFYFYYVNSSWDEMSLNVTNAPTEDSLPFYGPINVTFPNNYGNREYNITNAYNQWKTGGKVNNGFTIYSTTVGCNNAAVTIGNYTSDDTIASRRPYLKIYYNSTKLNELNQELNVKAYPNPFNNELKINLTDIDSYFLTDVAGRKHTVSFDNKSGIFNTANLKSGIYILRIEKDDKVKNLKVIKG